MKKLTTILLTVLLLLAAKTVNAQYPSPIYNGLTMYGSGVINLGTWSTTGRPGSPSAGSIGFNTTIGGIDFWTGSAWVDIQAGGTVTTVSVASANGFAGTVANPTTTPVITISTSITGALKGNGTAVSQAACADLSNGATGCSTAIGTSGATIPLLNGTNTWSGVQTYGEVIQAVTSQSGTTYNLAATDCGTLILFTSNSAVTVTAVNSLPVGCWISLEQSGTAKVSVSAGASATLNSPHSYTGTFAQHSLIGVVVISNAGSAAVYDLWGDGS